jgi:pimeloyl-ACP methyl ester carboxylesterase
VKISDNSRTIPFTDFGGNGPPLHFLHANGYPPACYRPLIDRLTRHYHLLAMHLRPLWPDSKPTDLDDWLPLTDDFLRFLDQRETGAVIGVGHSIGAIVMLRAALRQSKHFRALVLIEPVLFPPYFIIFWNILRSLGLSYKIHPLVSRTLKRRHSFQNLKTIFHGYRRRSVFRYFSDESLRTYIEGITQSKPNGEYELTYSPEWEARIYYTGIWRDLDIWHSLPKLSVPTLVIRGAESDTFRRSAARGLQRKLPSSRFVSLEQATHLVPLEKPQQVYELIQSFLEETL